MHRCFLPILLILASLSALPAAEPHPAAIDAILAAHWKQLGLAPNPPADDATFLRRVYLDVIGRIPTYREARSFLDSTDPDKRARLIDALLAHEGYAMHFYHFWADILRAKSEETRRLHHSAYCQYIRDSLRENRPYDEWARELVSSLGDTWDHPATGYYLRDTGMPLDNLANTIRVFLGTRIECAQCHDHPFDKWKQMDFYKLAAFTHGVDIKTFKEVSPFRETLDLIGPYKGPERPKMPTALSNSLGVMNYTGAIWRGLPLKLPHDYQYDDATPHDLVSPAVPFGKAGPTGEGAEQLQTFADWMTAPDNPRFTTVIVNRLWKKLFGAGVIDPVDDLTDQSQPAIPELESFLEIRMREGGYDLKAFLRMVLNTRAYQAGTVHEEPAPGVPASFTGPYLRRFTAEQAWDSFVALINPTPEMRNAIREEFLRRRLAYAEDFNAAMTAQTPEELFENVRRASAVYVKNALATQAWQVEFDRARAAGDKEKAREIGELMSHAMDDQAEAIRANVFDPAFAKFEKREGRPVAGGTVETGNILTDVTREFQQNPPPEPWSGQFAADVMRYQVPEENHAAFLKTRRRHATDFLRAAEIESPAPAGHFLREFGQSDRDVIENASTDASIPQALQLMNSPLLQELRQPWSVLSIELQQESDLEKRMEIVYVSLLSRLPTDRERAIWEKARETGGLSQEQDLIHALLNTRQFLFVR
jgi:hypothetical protein